MVPELTDPDDLAWLTYSYARVFGVTADVVYKALCSAGVLARVPVQAQAHKLFEHYWRAFPPPLTRKFGAGER